jgi:hypothetical protein
VTQFGDVAIADDDVGIAVQERRQQPRNLVRRVLIVGIRIDDEVGTGFQRRVDPRHECRGETLVASQPHDVIGAAPPCHLRRPVARSIVHHEDFDDVDSSDDAREIGERRGQRRRLVETRDLDDELCHRARNTSIRR